MKRTNSLVVIALLSLCALAREGGASAATSATDLLQLLPDGSAVAVVDVQKFIGSPVWATLNSQEKIRREIEKMQSDIADVGISLENVQSVAAAFSKTDFSHPTVAVTGGFDQYTLLSKLRANAKVKVSSESYKNFEITSVESATKAADAKNTPVAFVFFDPSTAVVGSRDSVIASIETKLGAKSIAQNSQLTDALSQNPFSAIRLAMTVTPEMSAKLQSNQLPLPDFSSIRMIWAAIDFSSGIDLTANLRNDSAEHARTIADRLNNLLGMVRGMLGSSNDPKMAGIIEVLKTVSITDADVDVKITGNVSLDLLNTLLGGAANPAPKKP